MSEFLNKTKLGRDAREFLDYLYFRITKLLGISKKLRGILALTVIVFVLCVQYFNKKEGSTSKDIKLNLVNITGDNNHVNINKAEVKAEELILQDSEDCYTDWILFTDTYWEGLTKGFRNVNGVYSPPVEDRKVDSVAWFNKPCKGPIKVEAEFISFPNKLINFNFYYGNWFRWEIGGRDLRSVRLFKNAQGCSAFQDSVPTTIPKNFLPTGEEITPSQSVTATMLVFLTKSGKLRTELHLGYTSKTSQERSTDNTSFFKEFEVGWRCDDDTLLNIEADSERIGVGVMKSYVEGDELPKVKLERFRAENYKEESNY